MIRSQTPTIAVSSWSLHRTLGAAWWDSPSGRTGREPTWGNGTLPVLDLPAAAAGNGIHQLHLCHFHVADRDPVWLSEFRAACTDAGVTLSMLLIDDGDLTDPVHHARDRAWIAGWIETAAVLGASSARVVAGKRKPSPEAITLAVAGLTALVPVGRVAGVAIVTENWHDLLAGPAEVDAVLDAVGDGLGLLADFGNWDGPAKYVGLARILRRADDVHAKASFGAAGMDTDDFGRCIDVAIAAGYGGPWTLIYDGPDADEWANIAIERRFVLDRLAMAAPERRTA